MEGFLLFVLGAIFLLLLYLYLHSRLSAIIEKKLHELYRKDLQKDLADFYREMEGYAALIEGKINRYKNLVERHDALLRKWEKLSEEFKKNKKTKEIGEVIEKSLENEEKIIELLEKNLARTPQSTNEKTPPPVTIKTPAQETLVREPNFALEILEEEKLHQDSKNKEKQEAPKTMEPKNTKTWQDFFRQVGRLVLPQEQNKPDFVTLLDIPQKPKEKSFGPKEKTNPPKEEKPLVKKIDPSELSLLVEKMQKEPSSRPAILRVLLQHNIPLAMISHLTGIELSQLEAIRQLYKL